MGPQRSIAADEVATLSAAIVGDDEAAAVRAGEEFPAAWQALTEAEQEGPRLESAARVARERLDADDAVRRKHGRTSTRSATRGRSCVGSCGT